MTYTRPVKFRKPHTPETEVKKLCLDYLRKRFGRRIWIHNTTAGGGLKRKKGTPDNLICLKIKEKELGRFIAIEFKSKQGVLSSEQGQVCADIIEAGGMVLVIKSLEELMEVFR